MYFEWVDYCFEDAVLVNSWLDPQTAAMTGLDQGWDEYWQAVLADAKNFPGCRDFCKIVRKNSLSIAVVAFGCYQGTAVISEIIVAPDLRSKGYGSEIIQELLTCSDILLGECNNKFTAVIFPDNLPSKKAFAKAGFVPGHVTADSETWVYYPARSLLV